MNNTEKTLKYYNEKTKNFVEGTINVEFSNLQDEFLKLIKPNGKILDLGCGSGRDSKAFLEKGYDVVSVDGSIELCKIASKYIGRDVICKTFQDFETDEMFDGIFACASLLHLEYEDIKKVMKKLSRNLNEGGCFYASFKYGDFIGERNGRFFTDLNEESFKSILDDIPELKIKKENITVDVRPGRENEKWLNLYLIKKDKIILYKTEEKK